MFIHNFKYAMKTMFRNKTALLWTLLFPIALGTFMYMAFGNIFEQDAVFHTIPIAVVKESENETFEEMLSVLAEDEEVLEITYAKDEDAKSLLEKEKVSGIVYINQELRLVVSENSYDTSILKTIVDEYKKQETMITDIAINYPQNLEAAIKGLSENTVFYVEKTTSDGNQDMTTQYFYAIFAMSCLFGSFAAMEKVGKIQANVSPLGMRRCMSPNSKVVNIVAEFLSLLILQFVVEVLAFLYFIVLGVDFGTKYPQILGILFFGCCIGISLGIIVGAISNISENSKSGVCVVISMALSVMADLVVSGIKDSIEHTMPILNRINPAALIVDSFYALNVYDTYERYLKNMAILGFMTILLLAISFLMLRRNKYASV